jgi:tankyrase
LIDAAWDADAVLLLIRAGANLNAQSKKGYTPLINCAEPEVARVLLAHGADPSIRDADGKTALELARQYGMKEKEAVLSAKKH